MLTLQLKYMLIIPGYLHLLAGENKQSAFEDNFIHWL